MKAVREWMTGEPRRPAHAWKNVDADAAGAGQDDEGTVGRLEFPSSFWEAAGGKDGDVASVVWRVAAALHALPLLQQALVRCRPGGVG